MVARGRKGIGCIIKGAAKAPFLMFAPESEKLMLTVFILLWVIILAVALPWLLAGRFWAKQSGDAAKKWGANIMKEPYEKKDD